MALIARSLRHNASPISHSCASVSRSLYLAPPFLVEDYEPVAVKTHRQGKMPEKVEAARKELENCKACPRNCGVDRLKNWDISQRKKGWELNAEEIADLMLKLQNETKCHNINFVTPEHVSPQVVEAIAVAIEKGLKLPIVYNTSSYDSMKSLELMDGLVDIYMPDFKFWSPQTSELLCKAKDYPEVTKTVIKEMQRQVGELVFDQNGLAKRGVIVRHLVMPNYVDEGKEIMRFIAEEVSKDTYVNIMEQYRPTFKVGEGERRARHGFTKYEDIDRPVTDSEMDLVREYAKEIGLWRFEDNEWLQPPSVKSFQD